MAAKPLSELLVSTAHAVSLAAAASAALGCSTLAAQEQPALIVQPTDQSRAELQRVLSSAFDGQSVRLPTTRSRATAC